MTTGALDILTAALGLPEGDRLELASRLIASVDGPAEADWSDAWLAELDRREQEAEATSSWNDVKARLRLTSPRRESRPRRPQIRRN